MRPLRELLPPFLLIALLAACAGPPPAPVEDRSDGRSYQSTPDGHYRVRRGDTLYSIAFRYGLDWRSLAAWNAIAPPYLIHPDDLLRLAPADASAGGTAGEAVPASPPGVTVRPAAGAGVATTRALDQPRATTVAEPEAAQPAAAPAEPGPATAAETATGSEPPPAAARQAPGSVTAAVPGRDPDRWLWPAEGRLLSRFVSGDPSRKGIDIAGEVGRPIIASAGGVVVYSGSGLIGYGELIIIKHSDRMLSAYAHNSRRLVSEGQQVEAGARIAEMGTNDRNQAVLHFEIRVNGSPVDPLQHLPPR